MHILTVYTPADTHKKTAADNVSYCLLRTYQEDMEVLFIFMIYLHLEQPCCRVD